jgi:hypothetical protein
VRCNSLVVTTAEKEAEKYQTAVVYDVTDIIGSVSKSFGLETANIDAEACPTEEADFDSLIDVISTTIDPDGWPDGAGPTGGICEYSVGNRRLLVIRQTETTHRAIGQLFSMIRKAAGQEKATPTSGGNLRQDVGDRATEKRAHAIDQRERKVGLFSGSASRCPNN